MDSIFAARAACKEVEDLQNSLRDAEIAYELQLREAFEASCRVSNKSGRSTRGRQRLHAQPQETAIDSDPSWPSLLYAAQLQFQENVRLFEVHADKDVAQRSFCEASRIASQIQHDKEFAQYVERIPEETWERDGDWIHDPWDGRDTEAPVTLTFAGHCQGNRGRQGPAGCAGALLTSDGSTLWQGGKALRSKTLQEARYQGLLLGLEQAQALGFTKLTVTDLDDAMLHHLEDIDAGYFEHERQMASRAIAPLIVRIKNISHTFQKCEFGYEVSEHQDRVQRLARNSAARPAGGSDARQARHTGDGGSAPTAPALRRAPPSSSAQTLVNAPEQDRGTRFGEHQVFRADGKGPMLRVEHQHWSHTEYHAQVPQPFPQGASGWARCIECKICLEKIDEDLTYSIESCSHAFCMDCLMQHVKHAINSRKFPVGCPWPECTNKLSEVECINLLDSEDMVRKLVELRAEFSIPEKDRLYCPNPRCSALLLVDKVARDSPIECPGCAKSICVWCKATWHHGLTCQQYSRLPHGTRVPEDKSLFKLAKRQHWRQCKQCKRMIELSLGCHHITCFCGHEFCYVCGAEWSLKHDERGAPAGPACGCDMFSTDPVEEQRIVVAPQAPPQAAPRQPCHFWQRGSCRFGARCRFRHG